MVNKVDSAPDLMELIYWKIQTVKQVVIKNALSFVVGSTGLYFTST